DIVEVDFNFEDELWKYKSNQRILTNISSEIQKVLQQRGTNFSNISLTIGTSQAFLMILPLDFSEGRSSINSKIHWELSNYFPDSYNEYIVNTYRLNSSLPFSESDEFLVIAVLKNTLEFIKRIFKLCNIKLSLIDIDHFSAENSLRKNCMNRISDKNVLLTGIKNGRADFGYIVNKKYRYYTYTTYSSKAEYNLNIVKKLKSLLNSNVAKGGVDIIFLYGDEIREDTLKALKKLNNFKVEILNPFESISSSSEYLQNSDLRKIHYNFASSCGVALRNF
ncbi:MAG: hypothetical protein ACRDFC_06900, partial [Ignavibacteria bacterium]